MPVRQLPAGLTFGDAESAVRRVLDVRGRTLRRFARHNVNRIDHRELLPVTITVDGTPYTLNEIFYAGVNGNNTVLSLETDPLGTGGQSYQGPGTGLLQIQNLNDPHAEHLAGRSPAIRPVDATRLSADKSNKPHGPTLP